MEIIAALLRNVLELFTWFRRVDPDEWGVHVRGGVYVRTITTGAFWNIPFWDRYYTLTKTPQIIKTGKIEVIHRQSGTILQATGAVTFEVLDGARAQLSRFDYDEDITDESRGELGAVLAECSDYMDRGALESAWFAQIAPAVEPWGLQVLKVKLHSLCPVRVYRLITDTPEPPPDPRKQID